MRLRRKRNRIRASLKSKQLVPVTDKTARLTRDVVQCYSTIQNENIRLPFFLQYYRDLGVGHFLIVDNDSNDGGREFLAKQPDVSLWTTKGSYKEAHFGVDWLNWLQRCHGHGRWCLVVDPDEFFVYPFCDTRPIRALTDWLDSSSIRSFGAMLLDMYPKGPLNDFPYERGQDPLETASWFDSGNYTISKNYELYNLWIQGGPRARHFFADNPRHAPALNKIPLVKWDRNYTYVSSTHELLPRGLNIVYDEWGGEKASGCLLHTKFLHTLAEKSARELKLQQHYKSGSEYRAYAERLRDNPDLWCKWSEKYINWRQLEILGLMSKGNWA